MDSSSVPIGELVPHGPEMTLIERLVEYSPQRSVATVTITAHSRFLEERGVPAWVGIEYMAQAASAFGGIEQVQRGEAPSIGLLIGARYYRCVLDAFPFGITLDVLVTIAMRDAEDFAAYDCRLEVAGRGIAECTLKAYRPRDLAPLLAEAARD